MYVHLRRLLLIIFEFRRGYAQMRQLGLALQCSTLDLLPSQGSDLLLNHHLHRSTDTTRLGTGLPKRVISEGMQYRGIWRLA